MNVVPLEPRTLARPRQPNRQHHRSLAGADGSRRNRSRRNLSRRNLSRRNYDRQHPGNHRFRRRRFCRQWFSCGWFHNDCARGRRRTGTRSPATSTSATAARRARFRFHGRGCSRGGLWRGLRLRSRRALHLGHWSLDGSFSRYVDRRHRLIIIESRLQGLGRLGCFLTGAVSGLLATF